MKTSPSLKIEFDEEDIKKAVMAHIRQKFPQLGNPEGEVTFVISSREMGSQRDPYTVTKLEKAVVVLGALEEPKKSLHNSLASQIASVESDPRQYGDH